MLMIVNPGYRVFATGPCPGLVLGLFVAALVPSIAVVCSEVVAANSGLDSDPAGDRYFDYCQDEIDCVADWIDFAA